MRLASLSVSASLLVVVGVLGGCGDNAPKGGTGGKAGGMAGHGGSAGQGGGAGALGGAGGLGGLGGVAGAGAGGGAGAAGAAGTGGAAGMGGAGGAAVPCYTTSFTTPASNNLTLNVSDDNDHTCADGFQYSVEISSGAPDGTLVTLYDGNSLLLPATVMGGTARFDVQLESGGTAQALSIQYPSTSTCNVTTMVTVMCPNAPPTCRIEQPTISATHPALNGVAAPAGDRISSAGSNYQVTFKVQTSAEDGQPVTLAVDNQASSSAVTTLNATASGGVATFTATLVPDGTWEAVATCTNKNGISATSTKGTFPVDTTAPALTVNSPTPGMFVVGANVNVCGQTSSADAAGLASSLGAAQNNYCVTVGSAATPICTPVTAVNTSTCVAIPCPGAGAFNLTLTLSDAAGNPTSQTVTGVTCVSSLPSVSIIAPDSDAPTFTDATKHILAANAPTGVKDLNAGTPGAQVNVIACTDTVGTAVLKVGHKGDATLTQLGGSVATAVAVAGDGCPSNLPNVVKFSGVTLPESTEDATGALTAATELTVTVTSSANTQAVGVSLPDDVWVDTVPPMLSLSSPPDLCTQFKVATGSVTEDVAFNADDRLVVLDVTNGATTTTYDTPAYMNGVATFPNVTFTQGQNDIAVAESDPAGNAVAFTPANCSVTVGMAPVVTFTTPTAGAVLCPAGDTATGCIDDNDTGTPGWQGSLAVTVTVNGHAVTTGEAVNFTIGGSSLGSANLDNAGHAQINAVTIPEGVQTITATTANIGSAGVGLGTVTVTVDTQPPGAPTGLTAAVLDRRQTSMQLSWTAPADTGGGSVAGYQIRYARVPIDSMNFDTAAVTTAVAYTGAPAAPGHVDGITVSGLYIENNYYFAVEAVDAAGTVSALLATPPGGSCTCSGQCCAAHFLTTTLTGAAGDRLGRDLDGSGDFGQPTNSSFTKDTISDLLVGGQGANKKAFLFFGSSSGYPATPSVTFLGTAAQFGSAIANIGDIDGDKLDDIAISSRADGLGTVYIYSRKNPPASWMTTNTWPATLADTQANYTITAVAPLTANTMDVRNLARLGNFDGSGDDDFVVAFDSANTTTGSLFVVKGNDSFASINLPDATNALEIDGTVAGAAFGGPILGLGPFFAPAGPGLLATASLSSTVYAFAGQSTAGPITVASANDSAVTSAAARYGSSLGLLGAIGSSTDGVTIGALGSQYVDVYFGTAATGPIVGSAGAAPSPTIHLIDSASGNSFGVVNIGGGIRGTGQVASLVGNDTVPDLVVAGQSETGLPLYLINGAALVNMSGTVDVASATDSTAVIKIPGVIPSNWTSYSVGTIIPDSNGDKVADFAVGESVGSSGAGRVIVVY